MELPWSTACIVLLYNSTSSYELVDHVRVSLSLVHTIRIIYTLVLYTQGQHTIFIFPSYFQEYDLFLDHILIPESITGQHWCYQDLAVREAVNLHGVHGLHLSFNLCVMDMHSESPIRRRGYASAGNVVYQHGGGSMGHCGYP